MKAAVSRVRMVQIVMLASIVLCIVAGEMLARPFAPQPASALFHALSLISIILVGATVVVRRTLILPSEAALQERSDSIETLARWRTSYLFLYVLCSVVALFGLILRMAGFSLVNVWGFYLGGFVMLLVYSPRVPSSEPRRS